MLRVFLPQVVLYGVAVVLTGVLQAHRRFLGPGARPAAVQPGRRVGVPALRRARPGDALEAAAAGAGAGPVGRHHARRRRARAAACSSRCAAPACGCGPRSPSRPGSPAGSARLALAGVAGLAAQQLALVVALRLAAGSPAGPTRVHGRHRAVPAALGGARGAGGDQRVPAAAARRRRRREYADLARRALRAVLVLSLGGAAVLLAVAVPRRAAAHAARGRRPGPPTSSRPCGPSRRGWSATACSRCSARALYARGDGRAAAVGDGRRLAGGRGGRRACWCSAPTCAPRPRSASATPSA